MMYHQDGLWDIFAGLVLIAFGIVVDAYPSLTGVVFVLLYPVLAAAKQAITKPRLRPEDVPPETVKARQLAMFTVIGLVVLLGILLYELTFWGVAPWLAAWLHLYLMPLILLTVVGLFAYWAYKSGVTRLFAYAGLALVAYLVSFWFELSLPIYAIALGAGVTLIGSLVTIRFIHNHPKIGNAYH